jgi:hypothetical protein
MIELTSDTQAVVDAFYLRGMDKVTHDMDLFDLATALRVLVNSVVPEETEAPKAVFDCEPTPAWAPKGKVGKLHYDHSAYLRRQFRQDKLDIRWEQRQQTRSMMLATIIELETLK